MQAPLELWIVQIRRPAEAAGAFPIARDNAHVLIAHRGIIAGGGGRIMVGELVKFLFPDRKNIDDIARLAIAHLNAERISQYEMRKTLGRLHRDLGGDPRPE